MAKLNSQKITNAGVVSSLVAADVAGDKFENKGNAFLIINNASAAAITVTIDSVKKCSQGFDHDLSISIAAGTEEKIGKFSTERFNDENDLISVNYSDVTSVTVGVMEV